MWQDVLVALCLLLIIEGLLPFLSPRQWRSTLVLLVQLSDDKVRVMGLVSMLVGTALLYVVH